MQNYNSKIYLVISGRIGDDQKSGFLVRSLDLVSEGSGGEAARDGCGSCVHRKLEYRSLKMGKFKSDERDP